MKELENTCNNKDKEIDNLNGIIKDQDQEVNLSLSWIPGLTITTNLLLKKRLISNQRSAILVKSKYINIFSSEKIDY